MCNPAKMNTSVIARRPLRKMSLYIHEKAHTKMMNQLKCASHETWFIYDVD